MELQFGAGSTVSKHVPADKLTIERSKQKTIDGWKRPAKGRKVMCGIIGAASSRTVGKILVNGLKKMEYRGYDSAGLVLNQDELAFQLRTLGKVSNLEDAMIEQRPKANCGIAPQDGQHMVSHQKKIHPMGPMEIYTLFTMESLKTTMS